VEDIVLQCLKAAAWLYRNAAEVGTPRNRIFVAGHSAGGHLTAMCLAAQWPRYSRGLPERVIQGGMSVSGVYDLRSRTALRHRSAVDRNRAMKVSGLRHERRPSTSPSAGAKSAASRSSMP
jgi:acetyl esterase/lipase